MGDGAVQHTAYCDGVEQTSAATEGTHRMCPPGDDTRAAVHQDGTVCRVGPELVIPEQLDFEELIIPAYETEVSW